VHLVQDFGNSPTGISRFLVFGEVCGPTMPATGQLWTWGFLYIEGHVQLHILSGGRRFLRGSWLFGAGLWKFPHTNFEIFGFGGGICTHGSSHRPDRDMGVGAYERACPTTYSIRGVHHFVHNWDSWCRGLDISHRNFEILGRGEGTAPSTGMLWTWGMVHITEHVKLHIALGG
jgi:hypothetical protein